MFIMLGLCTTCARLARASFRPFVLQLQSGLVKRIYDILGTLTSIILVNYVAAPFLLLSFEDSIRVWARVGFYGHFIVVGGLVFFNAGGTRFFKSLQAGMTVKEVNGKAVNGSVKSWGRS